MAEVKTFRSDLALVYRDDNRRTQLITGEVLGNETFYRICGSGSYVRDPLEFWLIDGFIHFYGLSRLPERDYNILGMLILNGWGGWRQEFRTF